MHTSTKNARLAGPPVHAFLPLRPQLARGRTPGSYILRLGRMKLGRWKRIDGGVGRGNRLAPFLNILRSFPWSRHGPLAASPSRMPSLPSSTPAGKTSHPAYWWRSQIIRAVVMPTHGYSRTRKTTRHPPRSQCRASPPRTSITHFSHGSSATARPGASTGYSARRAARGSLRHPPQPRKHPGVPPRCTLRH